MKADEWAKTGRTSILFDAPVLEAVREMRRQGRGCISRVVNRAVAELLVREGIRTAEDMAPVLQSGGE